MLDFAKNKNKTGFKNKMIETVQNLVRTAKTDFKVNKTSTAWDNIRWPNLSLVRVPEEIGMI